MFGSTMQGALNNIWPMLVIFTIVLIIVRLAYIKINGKDFIIYKELLSLAFLIYVMLLFELVTNTEMGGKGINIVPFTEIFRYKIGTNMFLRQVIGNIAIFIPFGYFISRYISAKKIWQITFITLITSVTIEIVQYKIGRAADIDDVLLNVVGGIIGFLIFIALRAIKKHLPGVFQNDKFYNLICILIFVLLALVYVFKINILWWK